MSDPDDRNDSDDRSSGRGRRGEAKSSQPPVPGFMVWIIILCLVVFAFLFVRSHETRTTIDQFTFEKALDEGRVKSLVLRMEPGAGVMRVNGKYQEKVNGAAVTEFTCHVMWTARLDEKAMRSGADVKVEPVSDLLQQVLIFIVPFLIVVLVFYFLFARQLKNAGKGAMQFGKSRARMAQSLEKVTFADVVGVKEAKEEVEEIIDYLRDPERFHRLGGRIPRGVLMVGPPGTGKTLLARAIAGEADVPFFNISGSDFVEMFVGVGASRVRDMFEQAKKNSPCIIFIDEIDAVGRSRFASGYSGGHDEREQTLNALLVEMDGFESKSGVIVIAATNRADVLDPALLRPGRFDRRVEVNLPDLKGREAILGVHSKKVKMSDAVDLTVIARGTPGLSGADLANLINEAALLAARCGKTAVELEDLEEARDKVMFGKQLRSRVMNEKERKITAYHEAGHALVSLHCEHVAPLHKVTIIPRGRSLGSTMSLPMEDQYTHSFNQMTDQLAVLMGGRVAEDMIFGEVTSGAGMDIKQASAIARHMVCDCGMSENLGPLAYGDRESQFGMGQHEYSEQTAREIDLEVRKIVEGAETRTRSILTTNKDQLVMLGEALLEQETLDAHQVRVMLGMLPPDPPSEEDSGPSQAPPAAPTGPAPKPTPSPDPEPFAGPGITPNPAMRQRDA